MYRLPCIITDSSTSLNSSEHVSKGPNQPTSRRSRNWIRLALKNRKRKQKQRPTDVPDYEDSGRTDAVPPVGERQGQSYQRRRIDINSIESRDH